jgi:hypothetical protein
MTELCPHCDKQFANRRSLATHKSRFHQDKKSKSSNAVISHSDDNVSTASGSTEQTRVDDSFDQHSEEGSVTSSSSKQSTSNSSSQSLEKGNSEAPQKHWDRESNKEIDRHSETDSSKEYSSGSENDSDEVSDVTSEDSTLSNDQYKLKRKEKTTFASFNDKLTKILSSIKLLLQSQDCKEKKDCFNLLFSYTLKKNFFAELGNFFKERSEDINEVLSEDEVFFIDALLATPNLTDLTKLMNENSRMVKSILHLVNRRNKRRKY